MSENRQHDRRTKQQVRRRSDLEEERQRQKDYKHRKRIAKEEEYDEEEFSDYHYQN